MTYINENTQDQANAHDPVIGAGPNAFRASQSAYFISLKSYHCAGDGVTDDSAKIQQAINDAQGKILFIPTPLNVYLTTQPIVVSHGGPIRIIFESDDTTIKYTGNGDAFLIPNSQNVTIEYGKIDLTSAGPNAVGYHLAGSWYGTLHKPKVIKNGANQIGILMETTATGYPGGTNYGAYLNRIIEPKISGTGLYDIRTKQTPGDTVSITHLTIDGGWISGGSSGVYLENVQSGRIKMITPEGGDTVNGQAIYIGTGCYVIYLDELGEMDSYKHGITVNGGNHVYIIGDNINGNVSDINLVNGTVNRLGKNNMRMNPSPGYFAEWHMDFNYALPVRLNVSGGGGAFDIIQWGDNGGLTLDGANGNPIHLNTKPDFKGGTASTVGAAGTAAALPSAPVGYILIEVAGTNYKLPYYNV